MKKNSNHFLNILSETVVKVFHNPFTAWIILAFSLCFTYFAYSIASQAAIDRAQIRFEERVAEIVEAIEERMRIYEQVLRGGVALFETFDDVSRDQWKAYVNSLDLNQHWPGAQGLGFSVPVMPENKEAHEQAVQAEGFAHYKIHPEGDREEYSSIIYLEPFDWRNQRALGYDMWSHPVRRKAMKLARDNGIPATSGVTTLVQETNEDIQPGFLTYLPLYKKDMPLENESQRRAAFRGWVYSPFRAYDFMNGILGSEDPFIDFEVFDGTAMFKEALLYDSNGLFHVEDPDFNADFTKKVSLRLQGHLWIAYFHTKSGHLEHEVKNQPRFIATAAIIVDILLFYVIYSLYFLQKRAEKMAESMNQELAKEVAEKEVLLAESEAAREDLRKITVDLQRSNKDLEQFAYVASHDLQEPVRKMVSYSQLFEKKFSDKVDEEGRTYINFIVTGAKRMNDLIQGLLKYARVGTDHSDEANFPLKECVEYALTDLDQVVVEKKAQITVEDLPQVRGVKFYYNQLFVNLISNALKYCEQDPKIQIKVLHQNDETIISVEDNGIGIDPEYQEKIFKIFSRLHGPQEYSGTGIGLSLCKRIVEQHGGRLWVESLSQGTAFRFTVQPVT